MYSDNTWITPLRIAEVHRQADQERSLRSTDLAPLSRAVSASVDVPVRAPVDTRAAGEPIAATAPAVTADCGPCRTADQAA